MVTTGAKSYVWCSMKSHTLFYCFLKILYFYSEISTFLPSSPGDSAPGRKGELLGLQFPVSLQCGGWELG